MSFRAELGPSATYLFEPIPAPRMTKAARWSLEPGVLRYKAFCAEVRRRAISLPEPGFLVEFHLAMPASWSGARRDDELGERHDGKPDLDNMVKGLIDAVYYKRKGGDSHVWCVPLPKRWAIESHFIVWPIVSWYID